MLKSVGCSFIFAMSNYSFNGSQLKATSFCLVLFVHPIMTHTLPSRRLVSRLPDISVQDIKYEMAYIVFSNSQTNSNIAFDIQENPKPYLAY